MRATASVCTATSEEKIGRFNVFWVREPHNMFREFLGNVFVSSISKKSWYIHNSLGSPLSMAGNSSTLQFSAKAFHSTFYKM